MPRTFEPGNSRVPLAAAAFIVVALVLPCAFAMPAYSRYQARQYAANQIQLNALRIQQTQQLVEVPRSK